MVWAAVLAPFLLATSPALAQEAERPPQERGAAAEGSASAPAPRKGDEEAEFAPEAPIRSIELGPNGRGDVTLSLDLGWLRSGFRADLGMGGYVDLVLRADTLLLYDGFGGQSGIHAGVRFTPLSVGPVRVGLEATIGELFSPDDTSVSNLATARGDLIIGAALDFATFYARAAIRGVSGGSARDAPGWTRDEEVGVGAERRVWKRLIVGAEAYLWARPDLSTLGEWRIRIGYAR